MEFRQPFLKSLQRLECVVTVQSAAQLSWSKSPEGFLTQEDLLLQTSILPCGPLGIPRVSFPFLDFFFLTLKKDCSKDLTAGDYLVGCIELSVVNKMRVQ